MTKENQRIMLSKRLLKEALLRLLTHKQLDQITVSELCKEASINRATFYRHYGMPQMDEDTWKLTSTCIGFGTYHLIRQWMTEDIPKTPQEVAELVLVITDLRKLSIP